MDYGTPRFYVNKITNLESLTGLCFVLDAVILALGHWELSLGKLLSWNSVMKVPLSFSFVTLALEML